MTKKGEIDRADNRAVIKKLQLSVFIRLDSAECIAPQLSLVAGTFYLRIVLLLPYSI